MKYFGIIEKMLRQYLNCNERLEIFLTCLCNILCYVGKNKPQYERLKYVALYDTI